MHHTAAILCVAAVIAAGVGCLVLYALHRPAPALSWWLIGLSALWIPLNNGTLEGVSLISFGNSHGLTVADLIGITGYTIGTATAWPLATWSRLGTAALRLSALAFLFGLAVSLAASETDTLLHTRNGSSRSSTSSHRH